MKKILLAAIVSATFSACSTECDHGYMGDNCKETWASAYDRSWIGTIDCGNGPGQVIGNVEAETPTRIRIDGLIYGELNSQTHFDIPQQSYVYNGNTYTVSGGGSLSNGVLNMVHTTTGNGQSQYCVFQMN